MGLLDDDFNFDDSDNGGFSSETGGEIGDITSKSEDFNGLEQSYDGESKNSIVKQALIVVIVGIIIVCIAIIGRGLIKGAGTKSNSNKNSKNDDNSGRGTSQTQQESGNNAAQFNQPINNGPTSGDLNWKTFDSADVTFQSERINCTFTITRLEHQVKLVPNTDEIQLRTIVTGTLSGFTGTYQIDLPYSKGSKLSVANSFDVSVEIGEISGRMVIGDIKY